MKKKLEFDMVTTRGGDKGKSSLYYGVPIYKNDLVFDVLGDLDELNSFLGIVRNLKLKKNFISIVQNDILTISAIIATKPNSEIRKNMKEITVKDIEKLEKIQHKLMKYAEIPQQFILPGEKSKDTPYIDVARTVTRRCERNVVNLIQIQHRPDLYNSQIYLNRLSDLLFTLARYQDSIN